MNRKISFVLALFTLVIASGCQKDAKSTVALSTEAKASYNGIGSYQLTSIHDRAIALDFAGTGKNYVFVYRIGDATAGDDWFNLMQYVSSTNTWNLVSSSPAGGGIGQLNGSGPLYPLTATPSSDPNNYNEIGGDHVIAFDWNGSGHEDHLLCYRPGSGMSAVMEWQQGYGWVAVYNHISGGGIGGYDLSSPYDKIISYDYYNHGKNDCIVCYRPGNGIIWILYHAPGATDFTPVVKGSAGIGGYDLKGTNDQVIAYDYDGSGYNNHLILYRPGLGYIWIIGHTAGSTNYTTNFSSRTGLGNFNINLSLEQDRLLALDFLGNGDATYLFGYRTGSGSAQLFSHASGLNNWASPWSSGGSGVGGFPLSYDPGSSPYYGSKMFTFNDNNGLGQSSLCGYVGGANQFFVVGRSQSAWAPVY